MVTQNDTAGATPFRLPNASQKWAPSERIGLWGWLGIYVTGFCLSFFLAAHVWLIHYASPGQITFKSSLAALQSPVVMVIELGLLVFAVVHGMLGVRRIILDLELCGKRGDHYLMWALTAVGAILIISGVIIFQGFSPGVQ